MDTFYTADEKYLQAIEELNYGELPKALNLFNAILSIDPEYARAYHHLGCLYQDHFKNYQTAGYYFKKCIDLDPAFPDAYFHYLRLLVVLKMHQPICNVSEKALLVPGVCKADIYEILGNYAEERQDFDEAKAHYHNAVLATANQTEHSNLQEHIKRISAKQEAKKTMIYAYQV